MSYILVFWGTVLTFSAFFATLAQQNPVQSEAETAAVQALNAVRLEAQAAAESDASSDINKLACFTAGAGAAIIGGGCGLVYLVETYYDPDFSQLAASVGGLASGVGIFATLIGTYSYPPNPPPEKLIGKSPEYVMFYADAYRDKTRSLRIKSAVTGVAIGGGCLTLALGSLLLNQSNYDFED